MFKKESTDNELWLSFRNGNQQAFASLYERYAEALFIFGFKTTNDKELIQDAVQELFVDLWKRRSSLQEVQFIKTYLYRSFRYKLLYLLKKNLKHKTEELQHSSLTEEAPETKWILKETTTENVDLLQKHINDLSTRQREVIHLKYFQGFTIQEIFIR